MGSQVRTVPRPLVRTNQWFIVVSVLFAWITKQEWILAIPFLAGLMGLFFGFNPVMRLAKMFFRKHPSQYIPEEWDQQQFNQTIAVICLAGGLISFLMNWTILGYVFTIMVAVAAFIAILGFCVGCYIRFHWKQYQYRRSLNKQ